MIGPVLIVAFWALLIWLWAHPQWFAPKMQYRPYDRSIDR